MIALTLAQLWHGPKVHRLHRWQSAGISSTGAVNRPTDHYVTSLRRQSFADELGACQAHAGGCAPSEEAAIRAKYQNLSTQQNIALANCERTGNCAPLRADVTSGTDAMLRLAASGALPLGGAVGNDMGQYLGQRLANDPAYRATVNNAIAVLNACNANPHKCTQQAIRASALVVAPLMGLASVQISAAGVGFGGTASALMNTAGQLYANGGNISAVSPGDVTLAGITGAMTYGATFWPNLFIGAGGVILSAGGNNEGPSDLRNSLLGVLAGTGIGYPAGSAVERFAGRIANPWYRPVWQDFTYTIQKWVAPSPMPGIYGASVGASVQESAAGATIINLPSRQK